MPAKKKAVEVKKRYCAECGNEMGSKWIMGFELTCSRECADKNNAKWRAKPDKEPSPEPEGRLSGVTAYSNNPDSPFMQWMAKEGATVEPKIENATDFGWAIDERKSWVILAQGSGVDALADYTAEFLESEKKDQVKIGRALGKVFPVVGLALLDQSAWDYGEIMDDLRKLTPHVHTAFFDDDDGPAYILLPDKERWKESVVDIAKLVTSQRKAVNPDSETLFIPLGASEARQVGDEWPHNRFVEYATRLGRNSQRGG